MTTVNASDQGSGGTASRGAAVDCDLVQQRLAEFRRDLYGGRGPGISTLEWRRATRERPTVAGIPTALSREAVHLQTLQARGQLIDLEIESQWAQAQFPRLDGHPR
jgi:hypothetical protein